MSDSTLLNLHICSRIWRSIFHSLGCAHLLDMDAAKLIRSHRNYICRY